MIAPDEKAKQNMAKSLFGGIKGPTAKPNPPPVQVKGPEPKKKV